VAAPRAANAGAMPRPVASAPLALRDCPAARNVVATNVAAGLTSSAIDNFRRVHVRIANDPEGYSTSEWLTLPLIECHTTRIEDLLDDVRRRSNRFDLVRLAITIPDGLASISSTDFVDVVIKSEDKLVALPGAPTCSRQRVAPSRIAARQNKLPLSASEHGRSRTSTSERRSGRSGVSVVGSGRRASSARRPQRRTASQGDYDKRLAELRDRLLQSERFAGTRQEASWAERDQNSAADSSVEVMETATSSGATSGSRSRSRSRASLGKRGAQRHVAEPQAARRLYSSELSERDDAGQVSHPRAALEARDQPPHGRSKRVVAALEPSPGHKELAVGAQHPRGLQDGKVARHRARQSGQEAAQSSRDQWWREADDGKPPARLAQRAIHDAVAGPPRTDCASDALRRFEDSHDEVAPPAESASGSQSWLDNCGRAPERRGACIPPPVDVAACFPSLASSSRAGTPRTPQAPKAPKVRLVAAGDLPVDGLFWLEVSSVPLLCIVHSDVGLLGDLWRSAHDLMCHACMSSDFVTTEIEDTQDQELRNALQAVQSQSHWTLGTMHIRHPDTGMMSLRVVGIGSNKKKRASAVKLALAVAGAVRGVPRDDSRFSPVFRDLVAHARKQGKHIYDSAPAAALEVASRSGKKANPSTSVLAMAPITPCRPTSPQRPRSEANQAAAMDLNDPVNMAIHVAREGQARLVKTWRERSKPRGRNGMEALQVEHAGRVFMENVTRWLDARGLSDVLRAHELGNEHGCLFYQYLPTRRVVQPEPSWTLAYHGTWFYALWSILSHGVIVESCDESAGHEFWEPGVYCSPVFDTAQYYARAQDVFGDGMYSRVLLRLQYDPAQVKRERSKGGVQLVLPSRAVAIDGVLFQGNAPPKLGEERLDEWEVDLEVIPAGMSAPAPISSRVSFRPQPDDNDRPRSSRKDPCEATVSDDDAWGDWRGEPSGSEVFPPAPPLSAPPAPEAATAAVPHSERAVPPHGGLGQALQDRPSDRAFEVVDAQSRAPPRRFRLRGKTPYDFSSSHRARSVAGAVARDAPGASDTCGK